MEYKGYIGTIEVDEDTGMLFGRTVGMRDGVTCEARTVPELIREFAASVDDYLAWCAERGEEPERPYSGRFNLRIDAGLHRELVRAAEARGVSLNALVEATLRATFMAGPSDAHGRRVQAQEAPVKASGKFGNARRIRVAKPRED